MAKIVQKPRVGLRVNLEIDEGEARALEALAGYGADEFISVFYEKLGEHYMRDHEGSLRAFLKSIREKLPPIIARLDKARSEFRETP